MVKTGDVIEQGGFLLKVVLYNNGHHHFTRELSFASRYNT